MVSKRLIPLAAMEQLLKSAGAGRVSDDAKLALKECLEAYALSLSRRAIKFAVHAGRKTVKARDVRLASES